jgi:hypothetical protein
MSTPRVPKRISASRIATLVIQIDGDKAIKDSDLAALFGMHVTTLYARIGKKLWRFKPRAFHKLTKAHDRGRQDARPAMAFTQAGVLLIAGILGDEASLQIGMDIAHALKTRRRSSAQKKRTNDPEKTSGYSEAKRRLITARLRALTGKILH